MVKQQISVCLQLIESMRRVIRTGKWQKLSVLEAEYNSAFAELKTEISAGVDEAGLQAMIRLEQQQRRLQRLLSLRLKETDEKLSVIEGAGKRLHVSSQVASTLI